MAEEGIIRVNYVPTNEMLADSLTKPLKKELHRDHCVQLRLVDRMEHNKAEEQLLAAMAQSSEARKTRKRKYPCVDCRNLFKDESALERHWL